MEEHGLHIIFGFYQNFFAMIREVYAAIARPPGAPLATWREACHQDAMRAGILFCGAIDLALAEAREDGDKSEVFLGELLAWAVSDDHVTLRKELGL